MGRGLEEGVETRKGREEERGVEASHEHMERGHEGIGERRDREGRE